MITEIPFALQLFSVGDDMKNDFEGTLKKVSEFGYKGVEFAGLHGKDPKYVRELCDDLGLKAISIHSGFGELYYNLDGRKEFLDKCEQLGTEYVVIPFMMEKYRPEGGNFDLFVTGMKDIAKSVADRGMKLCYHNHNFEFNTKIGDEYLLDVIFDRIGTDSVVPQLDLGWVSIGKEDPIKYLNKYVGNVPTVHIKDFYFPDITPESMRDAGEVDFFDFRPLGKGYLNVPEIIKEAEKCGTKWFIVEQDDKSYRYTDWTRLDCARMSMEYLHSL